MTDSVLTAYIECALWASLDYGRVDSSGNNPPLDENYGPDDLPAALVASMREDCEAFVESNAADLELYCDRLGFNDEQIGHDFWLTREGHGAGFWDRYYGLDGELTDAIKRLTECARAYGEFSDELNNRLGD